MIQTLHANMNDLQYSGAPLRRTPLGNIFLSFVKRCPQFRGVQATSTVDLGPRQIGVVQNSGVSFKRGSTVCITTSKIALGEKHSAVHAFI